MWERYTSEKKIFYLQNIMEFEEFRELINGLRSENLKVQNCTDELSFLEQIKKSPQPSRDRQRE